MFNGINLRFDDDDIVLIEHNNQIKSSIKNFEDNFASSFKAQSFQPGLLPPGMLFHNQANTLIVFERPPTYKKIKFTSVNKAAAVAQMQKPIEYHLPIPWQVYVAEYETSGILENLTMFFSTTEMAEVTQADSTGSKNTQIINLTSKSGYMMNPGLPNLYPALNFCIEKELAVSDFPSLENRIATAYAAVWESNYNTDLVPHLDAQLEHARVFNPRLPNYDSYFHYWQSLSVADVVYGVRNRNFFKQLRMPWKLKKQHSFESQMTNTLFSVLPILV